MASVVQSLTRTTFSCSPHPPSFSASTIVVRACSFASGETASSRSRNTSSAGRPLALSIILRLLPGTASTDLRGLKSNDMGWADLRVPKSTTARSSLTIMAAVSNLNVPKRYPTINMCER
ncbi:hypothetical protein RHRU231_950004 [Rhodococcus ruber]|uniref:Uncharacterized protein n=1 Tax=Rhodococcus ruber TaxID=1830 RepID=A0A098BUE4_9NOCA|nr:hypothetical protein RHRU231_950004 [Rhodococcus ruber]